MFDPTTSNDHRHALMSLNFGIVATAVSGATTVAPTVETLADKTLHIIQFASAFVGLIGTTLAACWYAYSLYNAFKSHKEPKDAG